MRYSSGTVMYGPRHSAGFSLVEVMVALIVLSVGLLGIAKMQALALSSTTSARMRSLAALEAASLASTMSAGRTYWANVTANPNVVFSAGAITSADDGTLQPNSPCPCTPPQIAYNDLSDWVTDLNKQIPNASGTVSCAPPPGTPVMPVSCAISINWSERQIKSNSQQTVPATATPINYTLYVDP